MEEKKQTNTQKGGFVSLRGEENKMKKTAILRRLAVYFKEYKWMLLLAILLTLGGNLLALVGPKLSGLAIDAIEPGPGRVDFPTVFRYAGLMAVVYILSAGMNYGLSRLMIRLSRNIVYRMRRDVFEKLVSLPVSFFDRHQTGKDRILFLIKDNQEEDKSEKSCFYNRRTVRHGIRHCGVFC